MLFQEGTSHIHLSSVEHENDPRVSSSITMARCSAAKKTGNPNTSFMDPGMDLDMDLDMDPEGLQAKYGA